MNKTLLTALALAGALAAAACGSDAADPVAVVPVEVVPAEVAAVGADLARPASATDSGTTSVDPLTDLAELLPPDTSAITSLPPDLMPPS